jgi:hypothetical protein
MVGPASPVLTTHVGEHKHRLSWWQLQISGNILTLHSITEKFRFSTKFNLCHKSISNPKRCIKYIITFKSLRTEMETGSSVSIVIKLWAGQLGFDSWHRQEISHHSYCTQTRSGANSAPYPRGTGDFPLGVKQTGHEADCSPPSSAEINNEWSYTSTPPYVFIARWF